jgi:hypothetical protein
VALSAVALSRMVIEIKIHSNHQVATATSMSHRVHMGLHFDAKACSASTFHIRTFVQLTGEPRTRIDGSDSDARAR